MKTMMRDDGWNVVAVVYIALSSAMLGFLLGVWIGSEMF